LRKSGALAAIFALLLQCALFAVHERAEALHHDATCAVATASSPAKPDCGKHSSADNCGVCQTLQHARVGLASTAVLPVEVAFTIVARPPTTCAFCVPSPAKFKLPVRAPPSPV
jgi:hypothetical protein